MKADKDVQYVGPSKKNAILAKTEAERNTDGNLEMTP